MNNESKENLRKILTVLDEHCDKYNDNCIFCVFFGSGECMLELAGVEKFVELVEE